MNRVLFSSKSDEWGTPRDTYDKLNSEFNFTVDVAASDENHMCDRYITKDMNALKMSWGGETVYCNPPYSDIKRWVEKCYKESLKPGTTVVMLISARTDTKWFHKFIYHRAEVRFIKGRLKFGDAINSAPFPSMIVIFRSVD
jgi:site-specific DNA-methyltransferase (adenine-specific)